MAPASEVSEKVGVPKQYLVTMSRKLREAGMLGSEPGVSGGYFLARPAEDISVLDIVKVTEGTANLNRCAGKSKDCKGYFSDICPVREVYEDLRGTVEELLSGITLAELKNRAVEKGACIK